MPTGIYLHKRGYHFHHHISTEERFWAKVKKLENGCWEWIGALLASGYGQFALRHNQNVSAHRISYEWENGAIPEELQLDHLCRNRKCVNPEHLQPVTKRDNILRGVGFGAKNSQKTHCPKGHPYDLFNTYHIPNGRRGCRICMKYAVSKSKLIK